MGTSWKHCIYHPQSSGQVKRINQTLKEILTKLTLETGSDWMSLLPFALYRVYNYPYSVGLTPFEILYFRSPLILPNHKAGVLAEFDGQRFLSSIQVLSQVQKQLWSQLHSVYEKAPPPVPHGFWLGDLMIITDLYGPADGSETAIQVCRSRKCISRI